MEFFSEGSDCYIGSGTDVGTPGTWGSVGCVMSVSPPTITQSFRDVPPCLNATPPRKVKKKPTTVDYGTIGVTLRFDADMYDDILGYLEGQGTKPVAAVLGDTGKAHVATCYIQSIGEPSLTEDSEVMIDVVFLIDDDFDTVDATTITGAS